MPTDGPPSSGSNPLTVFISYSSADRREALAVRRLLTDRGCRVWLDVFNIRVSEDVKHELGEGIAASDVLCLLLSPTAVDSPWVAEEITRGNEQAEKRGMRFIAVQLRPCRPPNQLTGKVWIDAMQGLDSPDVQARLARAVLGEKLVNDKQVDDALQAALQTRQNELEAAQVLPELAKKLDNIRKIPIRNLEIAFRHDALARDKVLAVGLEFDRLFSQPMWFLFAHYREGSTWPSWMKFEERGHLQLRSDGKRIDARFQWFDRIEAMSEQFDGTDLRDRPATFNFELSGDSFQPKGSTSSYEGGPTVPHLAQPFEIPSLDNLIKKKAEFTVNLVGQRQGDAQMIPLDENDLDIRIVARYGSDEKVTLFRSTHIPLERDILKGSYLAGRNSQIEREAILGLYPRATELMVQDHAKRREAAFALLEKDEEELSPEEMRTVATLRHSQAVVDIFRVFHNAPPPGHARKKLHETALWECRAVCRLLEPFVQASPEIDDVGKCFWAACNLSEYYRQGGDQQLAMDYAAEALSLVRNAAEKDPSEPEYRRWAALAFQGVANAQESAGDRPGAVTSLEDSIDIWSILHEELSNGDRRDDLEKALTNALDRTRDWKLPDNDVHERWAELLADLKPAGEQETPRRAKVKGAKT